MKFDTNLVEGGGRLLAPMSRQEDKETGKRRRRKKSVETRTTTKAERADANWPEVGEPLGNAPHPHHLPRLHCHYICMYSNYIDGGGGRKTYFFFNKSNYV